MFDLDNLKVQEYHWLENKTVFFSFLTKLLFDGIYDIVLLI